MSAHTHDDNRLTVGCPGCIQMQYEPAIEYPEGASAGQRLTIRNKVMLAEGRHPATGRPLIEGHKCAECAHHNEVTHYTSRSKVWHKCNLHRLGQSHSASSDIRVSWPACTLFELAEQ